MKHDHILCGYFDLVSSTKLLIYCEENISAGKAYNNEYPFRGIQ